MGVEEGIDFNCSNVWKRLYTLLTRPVLTEPLERWGRGCGGGGGVKGSTALV